jgi:Xaa-Pro aminopeptidase
MDVDGMIVPRADAYQSEDCAPHDNKLAWLTGFSGSAGLALILRDRALMFVDGRYQVQVRQEVDLNAFEIHHLHNEPLAQWLNDSLPAGSRIAFEPLLMVNSQFTALEATHCELVALNNDPFDAIWHDRPPAPAVQSAKCHRKSAVKAARRNVHALLRCWLKKVSICWLSPSRITSPGF